MMHGHTLITGVGRRAGLHLARDLLARGEGVIGTYRHSRDSLEELKSAGALLYRCDLTQAADIENLINDITASHSSLRAIVHNASQWLSDGQGGETRTIADTMMAVHFTAPYCLNEALAPLLLRHEGPHADIIHVGDYVSRRGSKKHMAYAASKAAQDNLTLSLAQKLAPKVKVNSVAPALLAFNEGDTAEYKEKALKKSLMQCEAGFDELTRTVRYLFDSGYVTGHIMPLDGGRQLR